MFFNCEIYPFIIVRRELRIRNEPDNRSQSLSWSLSMHHLSSQYPPSDRCDYNYARGEKTCKQHTQTIDPDAALLQYNCELGGIFVYTTMTIEDHSVTDGSNRQEDC